MADGRDWDLVKKKNTDNDYSSVRADEAVAEDRARQSAAQPQQHWSVGGSSGSTLTPEQAEAELKRRQAADEAAQDQSDIAADQANEARAKAQGYSRGGY